MAATSFAALKRSSKSSLRDLVTAAEKVTARDEPNTNENIWKPEVDKAGNGYSVIRFLPAAPVDRDWETDKRIRVISA